MSNFAKVEIVILNYNGLDLLKICLPSIIESARASKRGTNVVILDNGSKDGSAEYISDNLPDVQLCVTKENKFLCSFNDYARSSKADILILLNNDIKTDKSFVDPLIEVFDKYPDAFMVSPQCWTFDKSQYEGTKTKIGMKFGFFQAFSRYPGYKKEINTAGYTASAGSIAAFRRDRFIELGGYDDLYLPGRLEDVDVCYRGWKRGYKAYYVPESIAYHKGLASFEKAFGYPGTLSLSYRNTFLFMWKNITDAQFLFNHVIFLIPWLFFSIFKLNFSFVTGFFQALPRLPGAISKRRRETIHFKNKDRQLFELLGWKKYQLS